MKAQIVSVGNELLIGDTINTNASWLGDHLTRLGFEVTYIHTITDGLEQIKSTLSFALSQSDLVISTGGLGPTHDDMTKKAVSDLFGVNCRLDIQTLEYIKQLFKKRNIPFSRSNHDQAMVPENCEVLFNKAGTAPGMWFFENKKALAVLPGVPYEMKYLMEKRVEPKLREVFGETEFLISKYLKTAGIGESTLSDEILGDLSQYFNNGVSMAFLPAPGGVTLRLNASGSTEKEAEEHLEKLTEVLYDKAGKYIYGEGKNYQLSEAVGRLLKKSNMYIATAESCTGGLISNSITDKSGSSAYFKGGIVSYANSVKTEQLGVDPSVLKEYGAVSKQVALQMAKGAAKKLQADLGISATGVAGPTGGTKEKPVGTVWMGYYRQGGPHFAVQAMFTKDRLINKERTKMVLLEITRRQLMGIREMPYDLKKHMP